jgi:hypothetical protein
VNGGAGGEMIAVGRVLSTLTVTVATLLSPSWSVTFRRTV